MIHAEDIASQHVITISGIATVTQASQIMSANNIGFLPVVRNGQAVGVLTDRDIAIRGPLYGPLSSELVEQIMSTDVVCVNDDATVEEVAKLMGDKCVRRLLVTNSEGGLVGVISLDDLAVFTMGDNTAGQVLRKIAIGTPMRLNPKNARLPITGVYEPVRKIE